MVYNTVNNQPLPDEHATCPNTDLTLQELTANALFELLQGKKEGSTDAFMAYMKDRSKPHLQAVSSNSGQADYFEIRGGIEPAERRDLQGKLAELNKRPQEATREKEAANKEAEKSNHELENRNFELEQAKQEISNLSDKLDRELKLALREQAQLHDLQTFLTNLEDNTAEIMRNYFTLDNLMVFLVQSGQFQRLNLFWEACGKAVANGADHRGFDPALRKVFELFNSAAGDNPATLIVPEPGARYNSECQYRVQSDGTHIKEILLPGLRNPGGKQMQPALVRLV